VDHALADPAPVDGQPHEAPRHEARDHDDEEPVCDLGVGLVYHLAPNTRERWRWITPGAVLALALWLAMSWGLRLYVQYFANYNATDGSIGGVILLMLWRYLTSVVLLLGAEVDAEIEQAARRRGATTAAEEPSQARAA
jgi:membrane protein